MRTALKKFQQDAVDNAVAILDATLERISRLRSTGGKAEQRRALVADAGSVLIEAPTGIGKTLIAAHTVGTLCSKRPMLWLWFAPFQSVVCQTVGVLADEVLTLRSRNPGMDRAIEELKPGDVFVSTWATVAVSDASTRTARRISEIAPSLDQLILVARQRGWALGAVIDEAHHSFRGASRAFEFFSSVIDPDATILVTATPRDSEIEAFRTSAHLGALRRIKIPRSEGVQAGLLKTGIKAAVFSAPKTITELLDFRRTALAQGVATHRRLKDLLASRGETVTPLLMVQVTSDPNAEAQAQGWLKEHGFPKSAIMTHTAKEPDPTLNAVQGDESVEVLIFKMAVALGFDAPRAFTLVSFRSARDEDFGVQIVGRLMRVDRRLQGKGDLPPELSFGYVFLSEREAQEGIVRAGERINSIRSELASLETRVDVATINSNDVAVVPVDGKQRGLFPLQEPEPTQAVSSSETLPQREHAYYEANLWAETAISPLEGVARRISPSQVSEYPKCRLREGAPRRFTRSEIDVLGHDILVEIIDRFRWDDSVFTLAMTESQKILMQGREIFSGIIEAPVEIRARLLRDELTKRAQLSLFASDRDGFLDKRHLYAALLERLRTEAASRGLEGFETKEQLDTALSRILALRPALVAEAVQETFARHTITRESAPLPQELDLYPVVPSRLNLYGVYPPDLNSWERPFAELLDTDLGIVRWWHRNPVRKPWSVMMPIPGHGFFYPDLVVGVTGRKNRDSAILVEIKHQINDPEGNAAAKAQARHPDYGPVLMLYRDEKRDQWMTVGYDRSTDKNFIDRVFRIELLRSW